MHVERVTTRARLVVQLSQASAEIAGKSERRSGQMTVRPDERAVGRRKGAVLCARFALSAVVVTSMACGSDAHPPPSVGPMDGSGEAMSADAGFGDVASTDAGAFDAFGEDSSVVDTGSADTGRADFATADGAPDAGADSNTTSTTACTTAPCATSGPNSARCSGSPDGVCTPSEAVVMNYDIAHNGQGPGTPVAAGCYICMITNACLDADGTTNTLGTAVTSAECGDPDPAPATVNPPYASRNVSLSNVANCIDALTCSITGNGGAEPHCTVSAPPPASISNCFCGQHRGSACITSAAAPTGVCAAKEFIDLGTTDPVAALSHYTDETFSPGGVGNAILNCAWIARCPRNPCFN